MKKIVSMILVIVMIASLALGLTACGEGKDGVTPQLRINKDTNFWEVSYDEGATWVSMEVKATGADGKDGVDGTNGKDGADGKDGIDGKDGKDGINGKDGVNGKDGINGTNGKDGADGKDGKDGANGNNGTNGTNGSNGVTPTIGEDGYWYIGEENTGIYAGTTETVDVTFKGLGSDNTVTVTKGSLVNYYVPTNPVADFVNWYADEACTVGFDFNAPIIENTTIYSKWEYEEQFKTVAALTKNVSFGRANCFGTTVCFNSVYVRVLADDYKYYDGASSIANYLKGVFVEKDGVVYVNMSSSLASISYCDALTIINFSSAFSSYEQYILRNNMEMPEALATQKALAIKYFETVDHTAEGYNTSINTGGFTFPSMAHAVVALGSLMGQQDTERFDTLIKAAHDNYDGAYWNATADYTTPFNQLCAHYDWYDMSALEAEVKGLTSLTDAQVLKYYGYGIDLAGDYAELWQAWADDALSDNALDASEAKAFAYHYAYQLTGGNVWLGVYGSSHSIVDYN